MKEIRVEIKIKNNILYKKIFSEFRSVKEFSENLKLRPTQVGNFLNLSENPYKFNLELKITPQKIANYFKMLPEDIFPKKIYKAKKNKIIIESEIDSIQHNARLKLEMSNPENVYNEYNESDLKKTMIELLNTLPVREKKIINLRYFEKLTLEECGKIMGCGKERIRQIEKKAIRYLRHPLRSLKLEGYLYE